jgi:hypothetical protein
MALIKAVPKSDATNVFDLLQDVKAAIMEVPARANMNAVASVYSGRDLPTAAAQAGWRLRQADGPLARSVLQGGVHHPGSAVVLPSPTVLWG